MSSKPKILSIFRNSSTDDKVEALFKTHYALLCQGVFRLLRDKELSEDVVQEVFIKIWERRSTLEINENFIFYLKRSCHNAALNTLAILKSRNSDSLEKVSVIDAGKADGQVLLEELDDTLQLAINNLPERTRLVFTLSRYEEMSYKQIAQELQISVKAVEKHMSIALQRLRISLKDYIYVLLMAIIRCF